MGHFKVSEIVQEQFTFTKKARTFVGLIFVLGLVLSAIGMMGGDHTHHDGGATESHVESTEAGHHADATEDHGHGDAAHAAEGHGTEDHHAAEGGHGGGPHVVAGSFVDRIWANLLMNSYFFLLIAMGALFFVAVNYAANAGWSTLTKRIQEAVTSYVPIGVLILLLVMWFGKEHNYEWYNYMFNGGSGDKIMESKSWFLNKGFMFGLTTVVFAIWAFFRFKFRSMSLKEDETENGGNIFKRMVTTSAGFLVIFAFSFSLISWLVIMSIDAHWFSTIFSIYNFAVAFVTGLTTIMFFVLYLKSKGYLEHVNNDVIHDHGKFMFAFTIFWGYIFLAQWLLIWYAHFPEEVVYYNVRLEAPFNNLFYINIVVNFLLPFLVLMMRNAKRHPWVLTVAGLFILCGHWLDMYLMVMPGTMGLNASIGILEIGMTMAFAGLFIYIVMNSLSKAGLYPKNHPYILESANHEVGP